MSISLGQWFGVSMLPAERRVAETTTAPKVGDRATFQQQLDRLRDREKAVMRAQDAVAAERRRLPMVEVDASAQLTGAYGALTLLDAFQGRRQLVAYYFMWHDGEPAPRQCEGCTGFAGQVRELSIVGSRDVTFAVLCQGPFDESNRYREFMGWDYPWYSARQSLDTLLAGRTVGTFYLVCYLRRGDQVFETYWTSGRGVESMSNTHGLLDLTVYWRQEPWEDSPDGWPQEWPMSPEIWRWDGRPLPQWGRVLAGHSDDLTGNA